MRKFENATLQDVVNIAKEKGYKVYTFESSGNIKQIFFENQDGKIGTASEYYGGITFGSVHKPCRECGTGFMMSLEFADPNELDIAFAFAPNWATDSQRKVIRKYKDWNDYTNRESILTYYEL